MSLSIRSRLLLLVIAVLLPAAAAAVWTIARTYEIEREALERNLRDTTRALSMVVDRELTQRATIARLLATSSTLDGAPDLPAPALAAFDQQARRATDGILGWVELRSADRVLVNTRLPPGASPRPRPGNPVPLKNSPTITPLEPGTHGGEWGAAWVQPIQHGGRTVLELSVALLPAELQRIIDRQHLPPGWLGTVMDGHGTVVARFPGGSAYTGKHARPRLLNLISRQQEGLFESVSLDGQPVTGYFSKSPQGWSYISAMPRAEFTGQVPAAVRHLAIGALALLVLAVGGALWVTHRIAGPVHSLKKAAARMQAGRPVERRRTGIAECDEVVAALADASHAIAHSRADMARQVEQAVARTREAEQRIAHGQRVEALGRLTGGVAHDFNNLLGVIGNSAYLIRRHASAAELEVPVAATLRAVEAGGRLTQHLLRFAGRHPARSETVDLHVYLPEAQELIKIVLGRRVEVEVRVAPQTPRITVDGGELELALINLALNARDALPAGGKVLIEAHPATPADRADFPAGDYVTLTVHDNGKGMAEDVAARAFEPFFTTKPIGGGTGLGLSQVHGFCAQVGGATRLASTPGLGTSVSLILPAARDAAVPSAAPSSAGADSGLKDVRLLLVDDNAELRGVTAVLLKSYGCQVEQASGPAQALRLVDEGRPFDVVLSDVVMPGEMDGFALREALRARRPGLPVVLISGYPGTRVGAQARPDDPPVLRKPCSPQNMLQALRDAIEEKGAAG